MSNLVAHQRSVIDEEESVVDSPLLQDGRRDSLIKYNSEEIAFAPQASSNPTQQEQQSQALSLQLNQDERSRQVSADVLTDGSANHLQISIRVQDQAGRNAREPSINETS